MSGRHRARRQLTLGEHAFWTIIAAVAVMTAVLIVSFLAQTDARATLQPAARPSVCVWQDQIEQALAERGEDPQDWTVTDLPDGQWGVVDLDEQWAYVDRHVPCHLVASVVRHEWMHLQQARKLGGTDATYGAYDWDAGRLELVADCGALLLGSTYTPYVAQHEKATGVGCSASYAAAAQALIAYRPAVAVPPGVGMVGNTRAWNHD